MASGMLERRANRGGALKVPRHWAAAPLSVAYSTASAGFPATRPELGCQLPRRISCTGDRSPAGEIVATHYP